MWFDVTGHPCHARALIQCLRSSSWLVFHHPPHPCCRHRLSDLQLLPPNGASLAWKPRTCVSSPGHLLRVLGAGCPGIPALPSRGPPTQFQRRRGIWSTPKATIRCASVPSGLSTPLPSAARDDYALSGPLLLHEPLHHSKSPLATHLLHSWKPTGRGAPPDASWPLQSQQWWHGGVCMCFDDYFENFFFCVSADTAGV